MKKNKIKSGWKEYFNFSARERKGAIFLSVIIFIQIGILYYLKNRTTILPAPDEREIRELLFALDAAEKSSRDTVNFHPEIKKSAVLFPFDPNKLNDSTGHAIGLTDRQLTGIKNYLNRGGRFRIKSDFKKMYTISEKRYSMLEPFILLPDSFVKERAKKMKSEVKQNSIELSTADSVLLMNLKGIGPVFASRIVRYREKLGGFYALDQLKEIWGFTDSLTESLLPFVTLENRIPNRYIHLNTDSFAVLAAHPYIKGKIAGMICRYRKQHPFSEIEELKQLPLVNDENFRKIAPYLRID